MQRNDYTSRILEIVGNIRKQKTDIDKVLIDTRELQKEINLITGQLDRQFTVTDDLLFKVSIGQNRQFLNVFKPMWLIIIIQNYDRKCKVQFQGNFVICEIIKFCAILLFRFQLSIPCLNFVIYFSMINIF